MTSTLFLSLFSLSCLVACPAGFFKLDGMITCHQYLDCQDLENISTFEMIGQGAVKAVYRATWKGQNISVSKLVSKIYTQDFLHGWDMLLKFQGPYVVQAVGFCENTMMIMTEYLIRGNAVNLIKELKNLEFRQRLKLCLNYAKILQLLHKAKFVNCDTNTLSKTLSQVLVNQNSELVLNDMDSLAENVGGHGVTCGPRPLTGKFVAPEQIGLPLPKYDEKTDIWKAASVCNYFLSDVPDILPLRYYLFDIHSRCKNVHPQLRPTADQLVEVYSNLIAQHDEL